MEATLIATYALSCLAFTGIWLINVRLEDAGIIDYYWGPGFSVIALVHAWAHGIDTLAQGLILAAVLVWSMRLAAHLIARHRRMDAEDGRYRAMRETGGPSWWWTSLFKVFLLQATLMWLIAAPLHVTFLAEPAATAMPALFWAGMAVFAAGLAIEWIADVQLAAGRRGDGARQDGLVETGLWAVSRHPNYVGEIVLWWGIGLAAYAVTASLFALAGPLLLTAVIALVSLPLTEQHMRRTRPGYEDYRVRVPALVGRPARRRAGQPHRQAAE